MDHQINTPRRLVGSIFHRLSHAVREGSIWLGIVCFALLLGAVSCGRSPAPVSPDTIASFDSGEISRADIEAYLEEQPPGRRIPPPDGDAQAWLTMQIRRILLRHILVDDARIEEINDDRAFSARLEMATREALARAWSAKHNTRFHVTRPDLEAHFAAHRDRLVQPEIRSFRGILVAVSGDASADERRLARERANELRNRLVAGEAFEEIARNHSDSVNAVTGGLVAPISRDRLQPEIADAVFSLGTGDISEIVESDAGFHIFRVIGVRPEDPPDLDSHLARVAEEVITEKRAAYFDSLVAANAEERGLALPDWPDSGYPHDFSLKAVVFELDGERIFGSDIVRLAQQTGSPAHAVRRLVGDLVLSTAFRSDFPEDAETLVRRTRLRLAGVAIEQRALRDFVVSLSPDRFETFFESNRDLFVADTQVELTQFVWPLDVSGPDESLDLPTRFADTLRHAPENAQALWVAEAEDVGALRRGYPLLAVSTIAERQPGLVLYLSDSPVSGEVIGPYRFGNQIFVIRVETVIPAHSLSYAEARSGLSDVMLRQERPKLVREWLDQVAADHDLRIDTDRLAAMATEMSGGGLRDGTGSAP